MKKEITKLHYLAILLLVSITNYGQVTQSQLLINRTTLKPIDLRSNNIVGKVYINESYLPATIGRGEKAYPLRYNAYQDEMEFKKNNKFYNLIKILNQEIVFIGQHKTYKVLFDNSKGTNVLGYFVLLYKGNKVSLLKKEKIKFIDEVKAKSGYDKYQPPTLKRVKDKLYIGYKNNTIKDLPRKKKNILKLFSKNTKAIEAFSKQNRLNFKKEEDLVKIFKYYNSLK